MKKAKIKVINTDEITEKKVFQPIKKMVIMTNIPLQGGCIRCEVLKDHNGMLDELRAGDIIDLPERRYKSLSFRGMVKKAEPGAKSNKRR